MILVLSGIPVAKTPKTFRRKVRENPVVPLGGTARAVLPLALVRYYRLHFWSLPDLAFENAENLFGSKYVKRRWYRSGGTVQAVLPLAVVR